MQHVRLRHFANLVTQVELIDDLFNVVRKAIKVVLEVGFELRRIAQQGFERELGRVVEDVARSFTQSVGIEVGHICVFTLETYFFQHRVFGRLQQAVQTAQYEHGQDDISVFAANEDITKAVVSN
jgi:hypothetical protein